MAFVVDGSEWKFDGLSSQEITAVLESFLDRIHLALDRSELVWIGENLQIQSVFGDFDLWSLKAVDSPISLPHEIWEELAAWLGRSHCYLDDEWPAGMPEAVTEIDGVSVAENMDAAWAHHKVREGRAVACLGLRRNGVHTTKSSVGSANVHWVNDEASSLDFWRAAIYLEGDNNESLRRLAVHAFPNLYFHPDVWAGLHRLSGGYLGNRDQIKRHFAILNDYGGWAFTCPPPALAPNESIGPEPNQRPSSQIIGRRFHGFNIVMAPENPNVYANSNCRKAREVKIGEKIIYCEWHAKIEAHQNRIHVHPPIKESGEKFIIAIIDSHLELP